MPSFSASRAAWMGAAPPKAIMVRSCSSLPRSTAWTRAAFAMFSSTISLTPKAASRRFEAERLADRLVDGDARLLGRELDRAAGEVAGIEPAQHDVGVGDGGLGAAAAVARGAGLGAGALGADIDAAERIDVRRSSRRRRRSRPSRSPGCAAAGRCPSGSGTGARPRRCANAAARRRRSGRSWRSCRPCRTTGPCRGRTGAPAPRPGSRRRPGRTRRAGSGTCARSRARRGRRPR